MIIMILNIATLLLLIGTAWHIVHSDEKDLQKKQQKSRNPKHK